MGFRDATDTLASAVARVGPLDAVVLARGGAASSDGDVSGWERVLSEHAGIVSDVHGDASWARASADYATAAGRPVRLVTLTEATTAGGRSRGQAAAQLARAALGATSDRLAAFAVSIETDRLRDIHATAELAAHLLCSPESTALSGAELVVGSGWFGLRSHPRPSGSVTFGGPDIPEWLDGTLRGIVGAAEEEDR